MGLVQKILINLESVEQNYLINKIQTEFPKIINNIFTTKFFFIKYKQILFI